MSIVLVIFFFFLESIFQLFFEIEQLLERRAAIVVTWLGVPGRQGPVRPPTRLGRGSGGPVVVGPEAPRRQPALPGVRGARRRF